MCGICGCVDWRGLTREHAVRRMLDGLVHRGPDGHGCWRNDSGTAALGHRRLAVLDPSERADQPMVDPSGLVLVFNGEFFGFQELRDQLLKTGRSFCSTGDTEVVLAALSLWGVDALEKLDGQFAFACWDPNNRRLILVRDRIGIKPLFWARVDHGLAFASEIPALLRHPGVRRDLNADEVSRWLQLGYSATETTLAAGVQKLLPGHLLVCDENGIEVRRWYDPLCTVGSTARSRWTAAEAGEELHSLLRDAVGRRLISDVPLGCFLSGGVDSSAVVGAAVAEGHRPETLTVSFPGGEDESPVARRVAAALGLDARVVECEAASLGSGFESWARVTGDPLADPSFLPTNQVAVEARKRWTVALSGDGGDELLSGYPRLRLMPRLERLFAAPRFMRRLPSRLLPPRRWAAKLEHALPARDSWSAYQVLQGVWPRDQVAELVGDGDVALPWPEELTGRLKDVDPWTRWRALDVMTFLPERMLAKVDRASMAASLEVRVPLLDHRIVELLLSLPPKLTRGKGLLRDVLERLHVPQPPRRKIGFEIPLGEWLRGPVGDRAAEMLFGRSVEGIGLDAGVLERTWNEHQDRRADHGERLLAVAILGRWVEDVLG